MISIIVTKPRRRFSVSGDKKTTHLSSVKVGKTVVSSDVFFLMFFGFIVCRFIGFLVFFL